MGSLAPPLRTRRLLLRAIATSDVDDHAALFADPDVLRYLYEAEMTTEEMAVHFTRRHWRGHPGPGEWCNLAVEYEGVFIGEVGLGLVNETHRSYEIGYVFSPRFRGMGLATEATRALVDAAFRDLGAHRVVARLDARNTASRHLLERLSFRREAHFVRNEFVKGEWTDELVYAVLDDEWSSTLSR